MLLNTLKGDIKTARKGRSKRLSILTTLYAEASAVGKKKGNRESTDDEVTQTIKIFINNINITLKALEVNSPQSIQLNEEKEVLEFYLPKQLTEEELTTIINSIIELNKLSTLPTNRVKGIVMRELKANYPNQYNGKIASEIVNKVIE